MGAVQKTFPKKISPSSSAESERENHIFNKVLFINFQSLVHQRAMQDLAFEHLAVHLSFAVVQ